MLEKQKFVLVATFFMFVCWVLGLARSLQLLDVRTLKNGFWRNTQGRLLGVRKNAY